MKLKKLAAVAVVAGLTAAVSGCLDKLGDVVGGEAGHGLKALGHLGNAAFMNESQEDALGQSVGIALTNQYPVSSDGNLIKYVNYVGLSAAMGSDDPNSKYLFAVLETPTVNAWSGPGGYVFISRGVLDLCQDEAELAGVLAHEIAHINHHDGLEEVKASHFGAALQEGAQAHSQTAGFASALGQGAEFLTKHTHSQESELKADKAAVQFLSNAGYDPASYLRFLQRLEQVTRDRGGQLMSTHPGVGQRIQTVAAALRSVKPGGQTLQPRFNAWVRRGPAAPGRR